MKKKFVFVLLSTLFIACSPSKKLTVNQTHLPLAPDTPIEIYELSEEVPDKAIEIGSIKIGDTGFSTNCSLSTVLALAKENARTAGGNAIKITEHKKPSALGSSCHRIKATILSVPEDVLAMRPSKGTPPIDSLLYEEGCAMIHFYRPGGTGIAINYDIKIDDETITKAKNKYKESVKVQAVGPVVLWAKTEARNEVHIDLQPGQHYYVRCTVNMGIMVGHPFMELVDNSIGITEYNNLKKKKNNTPKAK